MGNHLSGQSTGKKPPKDKARKEVETPAESFPTAAEFGATMFLKDDFDFWSLSWVQSAKEEFELGHTSFGALDVLDYDSISIIVGFLSLSDIGRLSSVNKTLLTFFNDSAFWDNLYARTHADTVSGTVRSSDRTSIRDAWRRVGNLEKRLLRSVITPHVMEKAHADGMFLLSPACPLSVAAIYFVSR